MINNIKLNVSAGGVFSKFIFVIQNLKNINSNFENVYINNIDDRSLTGKNNIFNFIFNQKEIDEMLNYDCQHLGNYSKFNPIENSYNLNDYKKIIKKIKFKDSFLEKLKYHQQLLNINNPFLAVHIRLCDMNNIHKDDYGVLYFNDFLNRILNEEKKYNKILICSDNNTSIKKLKKYFKDKIVYIDGLIRAEDENEDSSILQEKNFKNPVFWEEAFIEMLLLSKCETLICRSSNLSNISIIYSDTIKNIIRI